MPDRAQTFTPDIEAVLASIDKALAGHVLYPASLKGDHRIKYLEGRDTAEASLPDAGAPLSYLHARFMAGKKPGDYKYRDIAQYHLAVFKVQAIRSLVVGIGERDLAEAARLERQAVFDSTPRGWVYFIEAGGHIKIGYSANVPSRIAQIETASPFNVTVLRQEPGTYETEAAYHEQFAHLRMRGEWFRFEDELRAFLEDAR